MTSTRGSAAVAIVLVVVAAAIGVGGYFLYKSESLPFFAKEKLLSPAESADLFDKIIDAQRKITSLHSKQAITISVEGIDPRVLPALGSFGSAGKQAASALLALTQENPNKPINSEASAMITITGEGNAVIHDLASVDSEVAFSIQAKLVEAGSEQTYGVSGDFKSIDKALYLRVKELPAQLYLMMPQLEEFVGEWLSFDYAKMMFKESEVVRAQFEEMQAKQQEEAQRMFVVAKEEYREAPFMTITKTLSSQAGEGEKATRYRYELDKDQLRDFIIAAVRRFGEGQKNLKFNANPADIDEGLAAIKSFGGEMVVGNDTARLYSVTFDAALAIDDYGLASVSMESEQSQFGKDFAITAPEDAIDILELFDGALGSFGLGGGLGGPWDSDEDGDGLVLAAERLLCTEPLLLDSDGDGYNDRQEVDGGFHPLGAGPLQNISQLRVICPEIASAGADEVARDSQRVTDLANLRNALNLYLVTVREPRLGCEPNTLYVSAPAHAPAGWRIGKNSGKANVDGNGWLPVDLREVAGGSPLQALPIDPLNVGILGSVYAYACDLEGNRYELNMRPEASLGPASSDGGDNVRIYEAGTYNTSDLIPNEFWNQFP